MKTQMRFQKILMTISMIVAAITAVYALVFFSGSLADVAQNLQPIDIGNGEKTINAQNFYDQAQSFNDMLFILGIAFILVTVTLFITASNSRRRYYITNYISILAVILFALVFAIYAIIQLSMLLNLFVNEIDWAEWLARYNYGYVEGSNIPRMYPYYSDSKFMFILGYIVFGIVFINALLLTYNLVWKIQLMKGEKELLEQGLRREAAQ